MKLKDRILSSELLDYLFDELSDSQKKKIEKVIIRNPDYGRMLISLSVLKQRLGTKEAITKHLEHANNEMLKRLRKNLAEGNEDEMK